MKKRILLTLMALGILGFIIYVNLTSRFEYNDEFVIGNTPGNIMNNGYFCENGDTIYFANTNDYDKLYLMNLECKDFKRINTMSVSDINCAGRYLYFAGRSNEFKDAKKNSGTVGSVLSSGGIGLYRTDRKGKHEYVLYDNTIGNAILSGNYLYYQHYDKQNGLQLYKTKIDEREGSKLFDTKINPAGIDNGHMYFSNTKDNHNIYKMSLLDTSYDVVYEGNTSNTLVFQNKIYFLDLDNNYALTRVNLDGTDPEVIVNERVLTYNFSIDGDFIYYQIDNQDKSRMCQMDLSTMKENILLKGNFDHINVTSKYVFFMEYDSNNVYVIADEANPKLNMFDPPVIK